MNNEQRELALRTADLVEANVDHFDMDYWAIGELELGKDQKTVVSSSCNTSACLAGFVVLASGGSISELEGISIKNRATALLGLDIYEANEIFEEALHPDSSYIEDDKDNFESAEDYAKAAAQRMRYLAKTHS